MAATSQTGLTTHAERMAKLRREHEARIAKERADADARIAKGDKHRSELLEESRLHRQLLREQALERAKQKDRIELASRRGHREFLTELGSKWSMHDRVQWLDELKGEAIEDTPDVRCLSAWLQDIWRREGIDVRGCRDARIANGAAARSSGYIEIAPLVDGRLRNLRECVIAGHETGHILHPDVPDDREVEGEFGKKISVPSEIASWTWFIEHTPVWSEPMHADMCRFLPSYRPHANEAEAKQIDALCSPITFRQVQLRIAARN